MKNWTPVQGSGVKLGSLIKTITGGDFMEQVNVAIVGPYMSGKTTLLESILAITETIKRKGGTAQGNSVGDGAAEARSHQMGVEVNVASAMYGGVRFNFLDCPGSVEFMSETFYALLGIDAAIVVCEPIPERVVTLAPVFKFLDDWQIPHLVFINKIDRLDCSGDRCDLAIRQFLDSLKTVSTRPLVLHQYPIAHQEQVAGFIDLVTEQAYQYHPEKLVPFPESLRSQEQAARQEMLEALADFDDHLLEELVEEINPTSEEILQDLKMELGADLIVPVFMGSALQDYGIGPLLQALGREAPDPATTAANRGVSGNNLVAQVIKTYYTVQGGKLSLVRLWAGTVNDGMSLNTGYGSVRVGGVYRLLGQQQQSIQTATAPAIVALGRLEGVRTGDVLSDLAKVPQLPVTRPLDPVYQIGIAPQNHQDEVKLTAALAKLLEEDPSLNWLQHPDTQQILLIGHGEIHTQVAIERLQRKYNLKLVTQAPRVPYKETIRKAATNIHGRYKHQSGGHGQFGDVYINVSPKPRGGGFSFHETIVGGVVPRQYIPGVELGVREYLQQGPLGFPMVDVDVTLTNGSYHSVDSSEQAFRMAARLAMQEAVQQCGSTLLEPVHLMTITIPTDHTSRVLQLITGRRGQIIGYDSKAGWIRWDEVQAYLPQAEMQGFIVELRSLTMGVGFFKSQFDHLQEVPEYLAQKLVHS